MSQVLLHQVPDNAAVKPDFPKSDRPDVENLVNQPNNIFDHGDRRNSVKVSINRSELTTKPKHHIPCPFLRRRGFCKKGSSCDFSHSFQPFNIMQQPIKNWMASASASYLPEPNFHNLPFSAAPHYFPPPFRFPAYYPTPPPFPYPPPLMSLPTTSPEEYLLRRKF